MENIYEQELATLRAELDAQPARWGDDSSLETWFPYSAEEIGRLRAELASERRMFQAAVSSLADIAEMVGAEETDTAPFNIPEILEDLKRAEFERQQLKAEVEQLRAYKAECENQKPVALEYCGMFFSSMEECFHKLGREAAVKAKPLYRHPIPSDRARITERDALAIATHAIGFHQETTQDALYYAQRFISSPIAKELLNKLNADRVPDDKSDEVARLAHERQCLAEAIGGIAVACGDTRSNFTGPDLLQVCGDAAEAIKGLLADRKQVPAVSVPDIKIEPATGTYDGKIICTAIKIPVNPLPFKTNSEGE